MLSSMPRPIILLLATPWKPCSFTIRGFPMPSLCFPPYNPPTSLCIFLLEPNFFSRNMPMLPPSSLLLHCLTTNGTLANSPLNMDRWLVLCISFLLLLRPSTTSILMVRHTPILSSPKTLPVLRLSSLLSILRVFSTTLRRVLLTDIDSDSEPKLESAQTASTLEDLSASMDFALKNGYFDPLPRLEMPLTNIPNTNALNLFILNYKIYKHIIN